MGIVFLVNTLAIIFLLISAEIVFLSVTKSIEFSTITVYVHCFSLQCSRHCVFKLWLGDNLGASVFLLVYKTFQHIIAHPIKLSFVKTAKEPLA